MRHFDLFAGIGGFSLAASRAGCETVGWVEIDRHCREQYLGAIPGAPQMWTAMDVLSTNQRDYPDFDLLTAGFPCQPFSTIGAMRGLEDERAEVIEGMLAALAIKRPAFFLLENVAGAKRFLQQILTALGEALGPEAYKISTATIDAVHWVPQHRRRLWIAGTRADQHGGLGCDLEQAVPTLGYPYTLGEILEPPPEPGLYLCSPVHEANLRKKERGKANWNPQRQIFSPDDVTGTLLRTYRDANSGPVVRLPDGRLRFLTGRECARLMGYPDDYPIVVDEREFYRQIGNSVVVPQVEALLRVLLSGEHLVPDLGLERAS